MHKKIKNILITISLSLILGISIPFQVQATEETSEETTESTSEESTEETTEEENEDGGEWKEDENGQVSYEIENKKVKGWYKIKEYWYFFGSDGIMQHDTNVGIYTLNSEGQLTNVPSSEDFKPKPHGKLYNAANSVILKDGNGDSENVKTMINTLYESYKAGENIDANKIKEARYSYNSLNEAQKVMVDNESKLASLEIKYGITYDYDEIYATDTDAVKADGNTKQGTSYSFNIDDRQENLTIVVRYTTDSNMDGTGDVPSISLLTPSSETIEVTNISPQIRNASINTALTWTDNFTQLDIASAEDGTWTIYTDIACTFEAREYAGNRTDINPIPSTDGTQTMTDAKGEEPEDEEESEKPNYLMLILLGLLIIAMIGVIIGVKYIPMGSDKKGSKGKSDPKVPQMSPEEEYEMLKAELTELDKEYTDESYDDDINIAQPQQNVQTPNMNQYSQEEISESIEEYNPTYNVYEQTTNYYNPEQPVNQQNDYASQSISHTLPPSNTYDGDEWYEDEE